MRGDSEKLRAVLLNLLLNAADTMPSGGTLRLSTEVDNNQLHVRIADEEPGVPPDLKDKIFEPFFSTKKEGTGFGLAMALQAVEEHDGTLRLLDNPPTSKGAVFVIELPLAKQEQPS